MRRKNVTSEMMMAYIEQALLLLMQSRPYSDITIGEITEKAGVNRSTYYRHFPTKDSIIKSYLDAIMEEYQNRFRNLHSDDYALYLRTMFEAFYEKRDELFKPFKKLHESTQGLGMGLAICKQIAKMLDGHVYLDHDYTCGSSFVFDMPFDEIKDPL